MNTENTSTTYTVAAGSTDGGSRLDKFLSDRLETLSRSRIKTLITGGHVEISGAKVTDPSRRVKSGDSFEVNVPPVKPAVPAGQHIELVIAYEDDDLIVIDKPAGLVVHPAPGNPDRTLVNALIAHCGDSLSGIGGEARPGIVHRLDKGTSGLMVAAKNDQAHRILADQFAAHSLERAYKAVVWGVPNKKKGDIEGNIGRNPRNRKKMAVVKRGGKTALTRYRLIKPVGDWASLVECRLATGRTHQIRVHMASLGHAVIGDPLYGGRDSKRFEKNMPENFLMAVKNLGRQALHAYLIGFDHPRNGEKLKFESLLPSDISSLL